MQTMVKTCVAAGCSNTNKDIAVCRLVGRVQAAKSKQFHWVVAQQWLNNRTVYLDFAACTYNQPANCNSVAKSAQVPS